MPDGVKVSDAYVSIVGDLDQTAMRHMGERAGEQFGIGFGKELGRINKKILFDVEVNHDNNSIKRAGARVGTSMMVAIGDAMATSMRPILASFPGRVAEILATPIGPAIIVAAMPAIVTAGITLGAMLGGTVLGALSTGAFAGAVALAINNPAVKQAFGGLGDHIKAAAGEGLVSFRKEMIGSIGLLKEAFDQIQLGQFFGELSPIVSLFASTIREIAPGINEIVQQIAFLAQPFAEITADFMTKLIPAVDRFLDTLAGELPGLMAGFTFLGNVFIGLIDLTGDLLAHWGHMFAGMIIWLARGLDVFGQFVDAIDGTGNALGLTGEKFHNMADNMRGTLSVTGDLTNASQDLANNGLAAMGDKADDTTISLSELKKAMDGINRGAIDQTEALEAWSAANIRIYETNTQMTGALSVNTEAGLRNRDMLQDAVQKSRDLALAEYALGTPMEEVTQKHQNRIDKLIIENFTSGETREEARKLAHQYGQIPTDVTTILKLIGVEPVKKSMFDLRVMQIKLENASSHADAAAQAQREEKGQWRGGLITGPGGGEDDKAGLFPLSNREFVIRNKAVEKYGVGFLNAINQGLYNPRSNEVTPGTGAGLGPGQGKHATWPFPVNVSKTRVDPKWGTSENPFLKTASALSGAIGSKGNALGGWAGMFRWLQTQVQGIRLNSGYRPGSMAGGGYDYHHYGRAVDIGPSPGIYANRVVNAIRQNYHDQTLELIHTPAGNKQIWNGRDYVFQGADLQSGHYDHVHWAMDQGGGLMPGTSLVANQTGRPEAILNPRHSALVGRVLSGEGLVVENVINATLDGQPIQLMINSSQQKVIDKLRGGRR